MTRGGKSRCAPAAACLLVCGLVALAPSEAVAAPNEYDLLLPSGGNEQGSGSSGSSSSSPTAPTTPTSPSYYAPSTESTGALPGETETDVAAGGKKKKKRGPTPVEPTLGSSSVNADVGPQQIPPIKVESSGGLPFGAVVLAILAAACCLLAAWRMRYQRELPVTPGIEPRRSRSRAPLARPRAAGARTTPSLG